METQPHHRGGSAERRRRPLWRAGLAGLLVALLFSLAQTAALPGSRAGPDAGNSAAAYGTSASEAVTPGASDDVHAAVACANDTCVAGAHHIQAVLSHQPHLAGGHGSLPPVPAPDPQQGRAPTVRGRPEPAPLAVTAGHLAHHSLHHGRAPPAASGD